MTPKMTRTWAHFPLPTVCEFFWDLKVFVRPLTFV